MAESSERQYERESVPEIKRLVDNEVLRFGQSRFALIRSVTSPPARLIRAYFRPKIPALAAITLLGLFTAVLEAFRLILFLIVLKLLVGEATGAGGTVSVVGFNLPLPFISDITDSQAGLLILLSMLVGITILREGLDFGINYLAMKIQSGFMLDVRRDLLDKLLRLESRYFAETKSGDIAYLQNTIANRFATLVPVVRGAVATVLDVVFALVILALISPKVTAVLFVLVVVFFVSASPLRGRARTLAYASEESSREASTHFLEMVHGIRLVKLGGQQERARERYLGLARQLVDDIVRQFTYQTFTGAVTRSGSMLVLLVIAVSLGVFSDLGPSQNVSIGLGYLYIAFRAVNGAGSLVDTRLRLASIVPHVLMVANFLLDTSYDDTASAKPHLPQAPLPREALKVEGLGFSYVSSRAVLTDVSVRFETGTTTALVGASGSGKTTLLELLAGFRTPNKGRILSDGVDLHSLDLSSYRDGVGYVTQDTVIFHDSLRQNLTFLRPESTEDELERAIDLACARQIVDESEFGLDTVVGERGLKVSGGQRQRIALARVLLQDAPVLLLDEATNALDLRTEAEVYENLYTLKEGRIIVVAAHRLSAITRFDQIVVLHEGRVMEQGRHEDLMAKGGLYFHLFSLQSYAPETDLRALAQ